jgi:hypothetical protein
MTRQSPAAWSLLLSVALQLMLAIGLGAGDAAQGQEPSPAAADPAVANTTIAEPNVRVPAAATAALPSLAEARAQAELLHEALHATLQAVHHQYFREDEGVAVPAVTLKSVFSELARQRNLELRWLAVNAQAMNVDHQPKSDFELEAAKAISAGAPHLERAGDGIYRRIGAIALQSECLKCHFPNRTSNKQRVAGLLIAIPIRPE